MTDRVVLLPGILTPAPIRFAGLIDALRPEVETATKELEVYGVSPPPPEGYGFEMEIEGVDRVADEAGFERFHLFGYSGGGAVALAYALARPSRVRSLALHEPASDFTGASLEETSQLEDRLEDVPADEVIPAFARLQLRPGIEPPPTEGPPPPWLADRPAGIRAFVDAMSATTLDVGRLATFDGPVAYSYGALSHPRWEDMAARLVRLVPGIVVHRSETTHHLRPSFAVDPERDAAMLHALWDRASVET